VPEVWLEHLRVVSCGDRPLSRHGFAATTCRDVGSGYRSLQSSHVPKTLRDVSTGLRLVRRSLLRDIHLESRSPFIGAELVIETMLHGYRVGKVGIQTFLRTFGSGSSTSMKNIVATMVDIWRIYRTVFSDQYELPVGRRRSNT
jgi:hypothetical protein